jgi:hypothetical protein
MYIQLQQSVWHSSLPVYTTGFDEYRMKKRECNETINEVLPVLYAGKGAPLFPCHAIKN